MHLFVCVVRGGVVKGAICVVRWRSQKLLLCCIAFSPGRSGHTRTRNGIVIITWFRYSLAAALGLIAVVVVCVHLRLAERERAKSNTYFRRSVFLI